MNRLKEVLAQAREHYGDPRPHYEGAMESVRCYCVGGALVMAATDPKAAPDEFLSDQRWPDVEHLALTLADLMGLEVADRAPLWLRQAADEAIMDNDAGFIGDAWARLERLVEVVA